MWLVVFVAILSCALAAMPAAPAVILSSGTGLSGPLLECFTDIACPDSAAQHPTLLLLLAKYRTQLAVRHTLFPLPYHRNGFTECLAALVVESLVPGSYLRAVGLGYAHQSVLYNAASVNLTQTDVLDIVWSSVASPFRVVKSTFLARMAGLDSDMRIQWKWGISARRVFGTPTFVLNGYTLPDEASSWTMAQWGQLLDPIVQKAPK